MWHGNKIDKNIHKVMRDGSRATTQTSRNFCTVGFPACLRARIVLSAGLFSLCLTTCDF